MAFKVRFRFHLSDPLKVFSIRIGDNNPEHSTNSVVFTQGDVPVDLSSSLAISKPSSALWHGRYVEIHKLDTVGDKSVLPLCEVVIIGRVFVGTYFDLLNIGKYVSQS